MKKLLMFFMVMLLALSVSTIYAYDDNMGLQDTLVMSSGKTVPTVIGLKGHYRAELRGPNGELKALREGENTVVNNGKYAVMDQVLASPTLNKMTHMAIGTGAMTCSGSTNALVTELDRNAFTSKTRANAVVTVVGDWAAGDGTGAITEAGTFDAASSGYMWMCASFSTINKGANDTLTITWTLTGS